jgi:Leucine-rich repeat (LRR) protein
LYMKLNLISTLRDYTFSDLTSVIVLDLGENRITKIEKNAFAGISKSLLTLLLKKNKLQFIKSTHFNALLNLLSLDLSENQISSIQLGSFDGLVNLTWLNLGGNAIYKIEARLFRNQAKLQTLILDSNTIHKIKAGSFQYLMNLVTLHLNYNYITTMSSDLFSNLTELKSLNLLGNSITEVDFSSFEGLNKFTELRMTSSKTRSVKITPSRIKIFPSLNVLILEKAQVELIRQFDISKISVLSFKSCTIDKSIIQRISVDSIVQLDLQEITLINVSIEDSFKSFGSKLKYFTMTNLALSSQFQTKFLSRSLNLVGLYLSNCNCTSSLYLQMYEDLEFLDMSFNQISEIEYNYFYGLYKMKELNLSDNNIYFLDSYTFSAMELLTTLDLSYNFINKLETSIFSTAIDLQKLDLSHNELIFINQESFGQNKLENLKHLDLSHNPKLFSIEFNMFSENFDRINLNTASLTDIFTASFNNVPFINDFMTENNNISVIKRSYFSYAKSIVNLRLSQNLIHSIEDDAFQNLKILLTLDLSYNYLTKLTNRTFTGMFQLQSLNLSSNQIQFMEKDIFNELKRLENLDLSNNFIKSMFDFTFLHLNKLRFLYIYQNPIETFFKKDILRGLKTVKFIFIGKHVNITTEECETIKATFKPVKVRTVLGTYFYDSINIALKTDDLDKADLKNYTRKQCRFIIYLLKNNIQLNLFDQAAALRFTSECSKTV